MDPPCEDLKTYKIKVEDEKIFIEVPRDSGF
jgi:nitrite reductase/ring-hydroxylating ferredoxin subunit